MEQQEKRKEIVIPYTPRELQNEIHNNLDRFNVVVCHRRFGKTVFAINQLINSKYRLTEPPMTYNYVESV